jgi:hypothetical protein
VAANEKKYLISPDEGVHLSILDITHKVTAEDFGGAFTITGCRVHTSGGLCGVRVATHSEYVFTGRVVAASYILATLDRSKFSKGVTQIPHGCHAL